MKNNIIILLLAFTALSACKKVRPTLGDPPSQTDAAFTAVPSYSKQPKFGLSLGFWKRNEG
jgi:hypothetical protein